MVKLPGATGLLDARLEGGAGNERMLVLTQTAAVTYALPSLRILRTVRFDIPNPTPVGTLRPDGRAVHHPPRDRPAHRPDHHRFHRQRYREHGVLAER